MQIGFIKMKVLSGSTSSVWSAGSAMSGQRAEFLAWVATLLGFVARLTANRGARVRLHPLLK